MPSLSHADDHEERAALVDSTRESDMAGAKSTGPHEIERPAKSPGGEAAAAPAALEKRASPTPAARGKATLEEKATPSEKQPSNARKSEESSAKQARRPTPVKNSAVSPLARTLRDDSAAPTTPAASELIQVSKNIPETAAKAAARKTASPSAASAPSDARPAPLRPATAPSRPSAAGGKARTGAQKLGFKLNEHIVYPAHGVGQIVGIEVQEVAGFSLELFVVSFVKDKMILKVPTSKVAAVGMRKLAEVEIVDKALSTLSGRARVKRTMWSRRAQEYEAKINSGDLVTIAEVVRDLYRSDTQPEQSYSERQLYEAALDRMSREIAAVRKLIDSEALKVIETFLAKGPRRGAKSEADLVDDADEDDIEDRAA
jgi:CarD family transcriptional regulator